MQKVQKHAGGGAHLQDCHGKGFYFILAASKQHSFLFLRLFVLSNQQYLKLWTKRWSGIAVMQLYLSLYYTCYILYVVYAGVYVFIFVTVFRNLCLNCFW